MSARPTEAIEDKNREILHALSVPADGLIAEWQRYEELVRKALSDSKSVAELTEYLERVTGLHWTIPHTIQSEDAPCEPSDTFFVAGRSPDERAPLSAEDHLQTVREQIDDLRIRNERQRSIIAQERRLAVREAAQNDRLLSHLEVEQRTVQEMAEALRDMAKANQTLQQALVADKDGQLRMFESHEGVVMHVDDDSVVVTYSINGDYIDQTYKKDQFIGGWLPQKGGRLGVYVRVAELPKERPEEGTSPRSPDEQREYRKHAIRPPREF